MTELVLRIDLLYQTISSAICYLEFGHYGRKLVGVIVSV